MRSIRHFRVGIGVAVIAVLAGQALGASVITYSLQLGGDNHRTDWKAGTHTLYSGGSAASGQSFFYQDLVNYAVVLKAEGIQSAGNGAGSEIFGAANVVFNVELHIGGATGPLATGAILKSTINDGTGTDPVAAAAFAVSYTGALGAQGRLIDTYGTGGPRMQPIFTYPYYAASSGKLIDMGAGYKEWNRTGGNDVLTIPGIGMGVGTAPDGSCLPGDNCMPNGVGGHQSGLGMVPIAEGQIDMSGLPLGAYTLVVVPGAGNNVLRGDLNMTAATNRPAFATAVDSPVGTSLTFATDDVIRCTSGIAGRYVFYNNSKWDGNTAGITTGDFNAIATDKQALLPGHTSSFVNYISYDKGLNGIIIDGCHFNRAPEPDIDMYTAWGASGDPFGWGDVIYPSQMQLFPGAGVNNSDRLVMTFPDRGATGALPNARWLMVALFAGDGSLGIPADDFFVFGLAVAEGTGDRLVNATDEVAARNDPHGLTNPAPITNTHDYNRDKLVNATDEIIARNNPANLVTAIKAISW